MGLLFSFKIVPHRTKTSLQKNSSTRGSPYKREKVLPAVCVCVCVCVRERETCVKERTCVREKERECVWERKRETDREWLCVCVLTLQPPGLQLARLLCPWDFPSKNTRVGCHFLPEGIFPTQQSNPPLLHWRQILNRWATREALVYTIEASVFLTKQNSLNPVISYNHMYYFLRNTKFPLLKWAPSSAHR